MSHLSDHPHINNFILCEQARQDKNIELIASENFCSMAVREAMASCLTNKYAEGYPVNRASGNTGRYYGGCQYVNELEEYCCSLWRKVFRTNYHVNVQPHSGSQANFAAYASVLQPGDKILSPSFDAGAHLTHSSPASFVSRFYNVATYGITDDGYIDFKDFIQKMQLMQPKLIVIGASAYPREISFKAFKESIDRLYSDGLIKEKPYIMVDMAHIAGLVAAEVHESPFGIADIITTTTHKTLRGPRGGMIFCKPELSKKVDSAIFPFSQGGPLEHVIAAKAVCAEEALTDDYKEYIKQVVSNCKAMADEFRNLGYELTTGGTDNHLLLIDFTRTHPNITGAMVQDMLDEHDITLNKNCVPNETRSPKKASGVRIGTAAMTTKGYTEEDFREVARTIDKLIKENL